jgi:hypothetical protein
MNFPFDAFNNFSIQYASHSCRETDPTNYPQNFYPHGLCSYCPNPSHISSNCPSWGQFSNFSYEQMNTNFSSPGFESNLNFYNPDWDNYSVDWVQHDSTSGGEHFPTAHIDDLAGRANQLMAARFAHALFSHTIAPSKSCHIVLILLTVDTNAHSLHIT